MNPISYTLYWIAWGITAVFIAALCCRLLLIPRRQRRADPALPAGQDEIDDEAWFAQLRALRDADEAAAEAYRRKRERS